MSFYFTLKFSPSIKGVSKNGVSALEFETPMDKMILLDLKMIMEEDQSLMREKFFKKI